MFETGVFGLDGVTAQRIHNRNEWDDDVISWIDEPEISESNSGYVSNVGSVVTIHIRSGYSREDLAFVKKMFGLYPENGVSEVKTVPFEGWEKELQKRDKQD